MPLWRRSRTRRSWRRVSFARVRPNFRQRRDPFVQRALLLERAQMLTVLALQGAETTPRDNQGLALIGGHRRLMDLAQIDRRMATGGLETHGVRGRGIRLGQRHMEFVMDTVPNNLAGGLCGKPRVAARPKTPVRAP